MRVFPICSRTIEGICFPLRMSSRKHSPLAADHRPGIDEHMYNLQQKPRMSRTRRLLDLVQILCAAIACRLAARIWPKGWDQLRTLYRDITALQEQGPASKANRAWFRLAPGNHVAAIDVYGRGNQGARPRFPIGLPAGRSATEPGGERGGLKRSASVLPRTCGLRSTLIRDDRPRRSSQLESIDLSQIRRASQIEHRSRSSTTI